MRARDVLTLCRLLPSPLVTTWVLSLARDGARREDAAILAAAHAIGERDEARRALAGERATADAWQSEAERNGAHAAGLLAEIETLRSVEASADDEADLLAEAAIEIDKSKVRVAQLEREVAQLKVRLDARPAHEGDERIGDAAKAPAVTKAPCAWCIGAIDRRPTTDIDVSEGDDPSEWVEVCSDCWAIPGVCTAEIRERVVARRASCVSRRTSADPLAIACPTCRAEHDSACFLLTSRESVPAFYALNE